jgi:hypothetical protein
MRLSIPRPLSAATRLTTILIPRGSIIASSSYTSSVLAFRTDRSNSIVAPPPPPPSSPLARTMARLTSKRRADAPGRGRVSKDVPERNL